MKNKKLLIVAAISFLFGVGSMVLHILPTSRLLWQDCQPETVSYESSDPYCLSIREGGRRLNLLSPFSNDRDTYIFVHAQAVDSYGHIVEYDLGEGVYYSGGAEEYLEEKLEAVWKQEGVEVLRNSGHKLFIPKDSFTGGR